LPKLLKEPLVPRVVSFIVLVGILLIIAALFFQVMAQFVLPLFLAAVLVVVFKPLHMWVREQLPGRLRLSALATTILIMLIVLLPTVWLGWNAYRESRIVFNFLRDKENQNKLVARIERAAGPLIDFYDNLAGDRATTPDGVAPTASIDGATTPPPPPAADSATPRFDGTPANSPTEAGPALRGMLRNLASAMGLFLVEIVQGLFRWLLGLIILILALYYFLVDGPTMIHSIMRLSPLDDQYEQELLDKFANVSRAVVLAVLTAAVAQGLLAGIGYYFALNAGAPVVLLMAMTMIGAVVPFVGAAGVWAPTCLWIYFYQDHVVNGVVEQGDSFTAIALALYCGGIVSTIDNVIKPLVLHGQSNIHPLLALMSVLGGIKALGPAGILIGPMVVAFIHALLVMVNRELRLMGGELGDGTYQKQMFPLHPALELEAEQATRESPGGVLEKLAAAAGMVPKPATAEQASQQPSGKLPAKASARQKAAKRRRGQK
jgi:predicted PurR-regulated permease PerM